MTVDLENLQVCYGKFTASVSMPEGMRQAFMAGTWDACGQLVAQAEAIQATAAKLPYVAWVIHRDTLRNEKVLSS